MVRKPKPFLCFQQNEAVNHQLALDYWEGSEKGGTWKWTASIEELSILHGIRKGDISKLAAAAAQAVNLQSRCTDCDAPQEITSRSAMLARTFSDHTCQHCFSERYEKRRRQEVEADEKKKLLQRSMISELSAQKRAYEYASISYVDAVLCFAVMLASDDACEFGRFNGNDKLHLCSTGALSSKLLERLHSAGILWFAADTDPKAVITDDGIKYSYSPHLVKWELAPDSSGMSFPKLMTFFGKIIDARQNDPAFEDAVSELWRLLAYDEALHHLQEEVGNYRLPEVKVGPKTDEAIWHALNHFSIPQVRREITNVVKNAAALSQHRDFARRRALNTIPGNLISYVDRAVSEGWQISPILHNWQNEEPILLTVLFNRVLGTGLPGFKTFSGQVLKSQQMQS